MSNTTTRREVLKGCAYVSAAGLLGFTTTARAQEKVDPAGPLGQSLQYVHESPDPAKLCSGCQLYTGAEGEEWGPCAIFPGQVVAANGYCVSWVQKAG